MFKKSLSVTLTVLILFTFSLPSSAASVNYSDVNTSDWFYGSLGTMSRNNIISGYPDGTFRASDTLQVDQLLAMLCRLTDNDVGLGDEYWAQNYIDFAREEGWLDGMSIYNYSKPINRFETARLSVKALGYTPETYPLDYPNYEIYTSDIDKFPSKYKDDVLVNYALGITRGYPDGTFQGYNTLTRAEGAVICHRIFDEDVRKPSLFPGLAEQLMALMVAPPPPLVPLMGEMMMAGPMMVFPLPAMPAPVPLPLTPLEPQVAIISENILADAIIEIADQESDNLLAAGYNYGIFNINLLSEEDESILIYTVEEGQSVITIDLLLLADEDGNLRDDAEDFILLICMNVDEDNGVAMKDWILNQYKNRTIIPVQGNDVLMDDTLMGISSLIHDHNVLKVTIQTGVDENALDESEGGGGAFN